MMRSYPTFLCRGASRTAFLALLWSITSGPLYAATGTEGASFLNIPIGGRPAALGNAYTAQAADAYAPIYNPGGLGLLDTSEVAGMHLNYLENVNYEFISFVHPFHQGSAFGVSAQYFNPGSTPGRDIVGNDIGDFSGYFGAYSLSYGHALGTHAALGVTGKFIQGRIESESAHAFGADIGALLEPFSHATLGIAVANMGSKLKFIDQADSLPLAYRLGASYAFTPEWLIVAEGIYDGNGLFSGHGGLEWTPWGLVSLRTGYKTDTSKALSTMAGFTAGAGIHFFGQEFDYAWVPLGDLGVTHYFSLVLRFGEAGAARRNLINFREQVNSGNKVQTVYEPDLPDVDLYPSAAQGSAPAKVPAQ